MSACIYLSIYPSLTPTTTQRPQAEHGGFHGDVSLVNIPSSYVHIHICIYIYICMYVSIIYPSIPPTIMQRPQAERVRRISRRCISSQHPLNICTCIYMYICMYTYIYIYICMYVSIIYPSIPPTIMQRPQAERARRISRRRISSQHPLNIRPTRLNSIAVSPPIPPRWGVPRPHPINWRAL